MTTKRPADLEPRYTAAYAIYKAGHPFEKRTVTADFDLSVADGSVLLDIPFDEVGDGHYSLEIKLDAKGARELAYSLLGFANDLD